MSLLVVWELNPKPSREQCVSCTGFMETMKDPGNLRRPFSASILVAGGVESLGNCRVQC